MSDFSRITDLTRVISQRSPLGVSSIKSNLAYDPLKPWLFVRKLLRALEKSDELKGLSVSDMLSEFQERIATLGLEELEYLFSADDFKIDFSDNYHVKSSLDRLGLETTEENEAILSAIVTTKNRIVKKDYNMDSTYVYRGVDTLNTRMSYFLLSSNKGASISTNYTGRAVSGGFFSNEYFKHNGKMLAGRSFTPTNLKQGILALRIVSLIDFESYNQALMMRLTAEWKMREKAYQKYNASEESVAKAYASYERQYKELEQKVDSENTDRSYTEFKKRLAGYLTGDKLGYKVESILPHVMHTIMVEYDKMVNVRLMERYESASSSNYALSWQTKKAIPKFIKDAMKSSGYLKLGFNYVEFDQSSDIEKLRYLEPQWAYIYQNLPAPPVNPDLRFRKLGNHRALGVYFSTVRTVAVDVRSPNSLLHEYGHHLDYYLLGEGCPNLSLQPEFSSILHHYQEALSKESDSLTLKELDYFKTPTEVFARAVEVYWSCNFKPTSFTQLKESLESSIFYKALFEIKDDIQVYFDDLLARFPNRGEVVNTSSEDARVSSIDSKAESTPPAKSSFVKSSPFLQASLNLGLCRQEGKVISRWVSYIELEEGAISIVSLTDKKSLTTEMLLISFPPYSKATETKVYQYTSNLFKKLDSSKPVKLRKLGDIIVKRFGGNVVSKHIVRKSEFKELVGCSQVQELAVTIENILRKELS